jgi:phosphoglycerate dehydrogenase-like enzyme
MLSITHIAHRRAPGLFPKIFTDALTQFGELKIIEHAKDLAEEEILNHCRESDVLLTGWGHVGIPPQLAKDPGKLRYVCNLTGELSGFVPKEIVESDIIVSNWGDTPAIAIAEGAMALLLGTMKDFHAQVMNIREENWSLRGATYGGSLYNTPIGLYGCGAIGRRFVKLVKAFNPEINIYDPYCDVLPEGCNRVDSLEDLFKNNKVISVFAGLSEETANSVDAKILSYLPDNGIVINTARGGIIDQPALFAELEKGRIRAGLDVLNPDGLEKGHPAREYKNLILTCHDISRSWPDDGKEATKLGYMHQICIDNLTAFSKSEPIKFEMDAVRYSRST